MLSSDQDPVVLDARFALPREPLNAGGHSRLYKAYDLSEAAEVAVKLFDPTSPVDESILRMAWANELDLYTKIGSHPNLLRLIAYGTPRDEAPWIAVEWCGQDLQTFISGETIDWDAFEPIAHEILRGLSALHAKGFVHRDVKPKNILIDDGVVKVADFGTVRIREVTSLGFTMRELGTPPYSPPEIGAYSPTTAYDIYSFAVLTIACVSGDFEMAGTTPYAVLSGTAFPDRIKDILARCLSEEPGDRPGSASVLLAELEQLGRQNSVADESTDVGIEISDGALETYRSISAAESAEVSDLVREFGTRARIVLDPREKTSGDMLILGRSVVAVATAHRTRRGFLVVKHVWKPWVAQLQRLRKASVPVAIGWRTSLISTDAAAALIEDLPRRLQETASESANARASRSEVHDRWERVLDAKIELARDRHSDINFSSFRVDGSRLFLAVGLEQVDQDLEQLRVIRTVSGRFVRGEIESVEDGELVLYVNEGTVADLPRRGTVSIDAERTLSKLFREQKALRRVFEGGAARPDLKDILNQPSLNPGSEAVVVESFLQEDLDSAKREALGKVLGASGLSVVQGPPGTGKTTLIAEIVAQQLKAYPASRILLASQTHIALDHALMQVTSVAPQASVLRIGNPDQFGNEVEPWSVPAQLERWREETRVKADLYVRRHLEAVAPGNTNARLLATKYKSAMERLARVTASLEERTSKRTQLLRNRNEILCQIDSFIQAITAVEASAPNGVPLISEALEKLVDSSLSLSQALSNSDEELPQIEQLTGEVEQLETGKGDLKNEVEATSAELREALDIVGDDSQLAAKVEEMLSEQDVRAQALQALTEEWLERFRLSAEFRVALLFRAQLVASTCVALTGAQGADRVTFDLCIIDEASKATPTELMVPMASSNKWILVGDEKQLPPFVEQELRRAELLERFDLDKSAVEERLFAELVGQLPTDSVLSLTQQHRMHPFIGDLVSDIFYGGRLTSSPRAISPVMDKLFGSSAIWHPTRRRNAERKVGTSFDNREEAREVVTLLKSIEFFAANLTLPVINIAILTGYLAQVKTLQELVSSVRVDLPHLQVRVATVDSFQGQETDICMLSLTRSNSRNAMGFLSEAERLNVAVSRARDGLIIVGDREMAIRAKGRAPQLSRIAQRLGVTPRGGGQ